MQLAVAGSAIIGGTVWFAVWGPPSGFQELDVFGDLLALVIGASWLAGEVVLAIRWVGRRKPFVRTPLGKFAWWAGIVSCLALFTGFLFGWMALFLAPAGALAGLFTVMREIGSGRGNDPRNVAGILLCAAAIVFLAA